jgi:hypothetical protein
MIGFRLGRELARTLGGTPPLDLSPLLDRLGLELVPWRFRGRLKEVVMDGVIAIDERLPGPWARWLTAHAVGHHLMHTGTWLYLDSWQWVNRPKAERQAEEFAAGLLVRDGPSWAALGPTTLSSRLGIPEEKAIFASGLLAKEQRA